MWERVGGVAISKFDRYYLWTVSKLDIQEECQNVECNDRICLKMDGLKNPSLKIHGLASKERINVPPRIFDEDDKRTP